MDRRKFIRVAGGGVVLGATASLAGCSAELPREAVAAWDGPTAGDTADARRWILAHAILAPHSHNLQSWLVDLREPGEILLSCDLTRLLPETDPQSRQIMMSQGTFLELLEIAAREKGLRARIELFPQGVPDGAPDTRPTARVRLQPDATVARDPLFAQILRRRTNREAYEPREPGAGALQAIAASVAAPQLRSGFVTASQPAEMARHRAIASRAWRIELELPRTIMESYRVLRVGPREIAQHRDGLSINTPMVRALAAVGLFDRTQAPAPGDFATRSQIEDFDARLDATPAFFWLVSEGNDRRTQVEAGRAYVRAQLAATALGLSMQPLSQALQEYPEQAGPYTEVHALLQASQPRHTVQMWARLGHAPVVGPSPRRPLESMLRG
ncbi:MAG TPA: twin-arginine translocation pathway signal protein [Ramlibacter sp.]|jgi:hypothetical protein